MQKKKKMSVDHVHVAAPWRAAALERSAAALERSAAPPLAGERLLACNISWRIKRARRAPGTRVKC